MIIEAWVVCNPQVLAEITNSAQIDEDGNTLPVPSTGHLRLKNAIAGFWKDPLPNRVFNVITRSEQELQDLLDAMEEHTTDSVVAVYAWIQGDGHGRPNPWPIDDDEVIALMPDHVEYDEEGVEISRTAATKENPNWAHVWSGQSVRYWAGEFSDDFSEEFY